MRARIAGLGLVCLLGFGACDQPTILGGQPAPSAAATATPALPAVTPTTGPRPEIRTIVTPTLSAPEAKNLELALGKIPADATVAHAIADGHFVFVHYAGMSEGNSAVILETFQFDDAGAVTAQDIMVHRGASADIALGGETGSGAGDAATEIANKAVATKFYETVSDGTKIIQLNDIVGDAYIEHSVAPPSEPGTIGLIKTYTGIDRRAQTFTIKSLGAWGDLVAAQVTIATSDGSGGWSYIPGADILRIADGKIVERWRVNY